MQRKTFVRTLLAAAAAALLSASPAHRPRP